MGTGMRAHGHRHAGSWTQVRGLMGSGMGDQIENVPFSIK